MKLTSSIPLVNCLLIFGLALGLASGQARAYDPVNGTYITSTVSCGIMTEAIKTSGESAERVYSNYISGFTNGINASVSGKLDFFDGTDDHSRYLFVLKYCEDNPLDKMSEGIQKMIIKVTGKSSTQVAVQPSPPPCSTAVSNGKKKVM
jgi:hypothetical protein